MTMCHICKRKKEDEEIIWHISGRLVCHDCFNDLLEMPRLVTTDTKGLIGDCSTAV